MTIPDLPTLYILAIKVAVALLILIVGFFISRYSKKMTFKFLKEYDETASQFISRIVYILVLILAIVLALASLGVPISPFTGMLTGIFFGIAVSLKTSYNIIASGIMLAFSKPFSVGEKIDLGGSKGIVKSIGFLYTVLEDAEGDELILTNSLVLTKVITKISVKENVVDAG
jgi:small conductance mechanosensitive channel